MSFMKERKEDDEIKKLGKAIVSKVGTEGSNVGAGMWRRNQIQEDLGVEEGPVGRGHSTDSELEKGGSLQGQGQGRGERTGINEGQLDHGRPSV